MTVGATRNDNVADHSVHDKREPVIAQAKKGKKGPAPKAGLGSFDACKNLATKLKPKLNLAVKNIRKPLDNFNASSDPNKDSTPVQYAVSDAITDLSGTTPTGLVNAGACLVEKLPNDELLAGLVGVSISSRMSTTFRLSAERAITGSENPPTNNEEMQRFIKNNSTVREYIETQAALILGENKNLPRLNFDNFINDSIAQGMLPLLFNAIVFRVAETIHNDGDLQNLLDTLTNSRANKENPLIANNKELNDWIAQKRAELNPKK